MIRPLLQHTVGRSEPWRVVVVSMLLCRTRGDAAEPVLRELFRRWPTPSRLARAEGLELLLAPLGLQNLRASRIRTAAAAFAEDPRPSPEAVRCLPGVGRYVEDAYRLVCLGDRSVRPEDKALRAWMEATGGENGLARARVSDLEEDLRGNPRGPSRTNHGPREEPT